MKVQRQRKIVELITEKDIETQEELAKCLVDEGYAVTQATVSRDIRELNLTKVSINGGKQKYVLPHSKNMTINSKYIRVLKDGILSMTCAGNLLVVRTVAGMAMAVAAAIHGHGTKYTCDKNCIRNGYGSCGCYRCYAVERSGRMYCWR